MQSWGTNARAADELGCDPFGMAHGFIGRDRPVPVLLGHAPEGASGGAERRPSPFTGVTMDRAAALTSTISRPFPSALAHGGVGRGATMGALPLLRGEDRAGRRDVLGDQRPAGAWVCTLAAPHAPLAWVAREATAAGRPLVGRRTGPLPLMGTAAGRLRGVALGRALCPPRSAGVRRPRRRCLSGQQSTRCCSHASGGVAVG
jgi:hypothetical protein